MSGSATYIAALDLWAKRRQGDEREPTHQSPTHPSKREAALRTASAKGGGNLQRPPPFVEALWEGCVGALTEVLALARHLVVAWRASPRLQCKMRSHSL